MLEYHITSPTYTECIKYLKILSFENSVDLDKLTSYEPSSSAAIRFHPNNEVKLHYNTGLKALLS